MAGPNRILVVDDEASIRVFVEEVLVRDGHSVVMVESGEAALERAANEEFDLALVDLLLGGIGGMEVMATLHERCPDTVVIVITGHGSMQTAVEALRQGAHDYLFKPVKVVELRESVRAGLLKRKRNLRQRELLALTRRLVENLEEQEASPLTQTDEEQPVEVPVAAEPSEEQGRFLRCGGLIVDAMRHVITLDGQVLEFSPTEFELVAYLINEAPRVVQPKDLVRAVQGYECEVWEASEMSRYHIHRIRQKIKQATGRTNVLRTVRGVGYMIEG